MEHSQELKMHFNHMKASFKLAKDWQPMWLWAMLIIALVIIFFVGFVIGMEAEASKSLSRHFSTQAAMSTWEASTEAKGDAMSVAYRRKDAADRAMVQFLDRVQAPRDVRGALADFAYLTVYGVRFKEADELKGARIIAERRLVLFARPQPDTLEEFRRRGISDDLANIEHAYERKAQAYSHVLGRDIRSSELVTDSDLRWHLRMEDERKVLLGIK